MAKKKDERWKRGKRLKVPALKPTLTPTETPCQSKTGRNLKRCSSSH